MSWDSGSFIIEWRLTSLSAVIILKLKISFLYEKNSELHSQPFKRYYLPAAKVQRIRQTTKEKALFPLMLSWFAWKFASSGYFRITHVSIMPCWIHLGTINPLTICISSENQWVIMCYCQSWKDELCYVLLFYIWYTIFCIIKFNYWFGIFVILYYICKYFRNAFFWINCNRKRNSI